MRTRSSNFVSIFIFSGALAFTAVGCGGQTIDATDIADETAEITGDSPDATSDDMGTSSPTDAETEDTATTDTSPDNTDASDTTDDVTNETTDSNDTTAETGDDSENTADDVDTPADDTPAEERESTFVRLTIDDTIDGPAFLSVADMNDDGRDDLIVSSFGQFGITNLVPNGALTIYYQGDDLESWTTEALIEADDAVPFPNGVTIDDIDGDGDLDIISASGFLVCTAIPFGGPCGGIRWFERDAGSWIEHIILPNEQEHFYHHAELVDFDGDGIRDMVITAEKAGGFFGSGEAIAQMFQGLPSGDLFSSEPVNLGYGLGSFPRLYDIDQDGDLDIASAEYFHEGGSFAWLEAVEPPTPEAPAGVFERHVIADDVGPSIMLTMVDDLYGDGVTRAVGSNHSNTAKSPADPWEAAIYVFDIPTDDPTQPWERQKISEGIVSRAGTMIDNQAAPGIFGTGDIDGDGDKDVVVSGDGDPRVFWLEQRAPGSFTTHVLAEELGQAGAMKIVDLDRDGNTEILVSSYDANVLYIFQHQTN